MESLYRKLKEYGEGDTYPFHMPGHKRNMGGYGFEDPFSFDITEIDGFDNLHHAQGILREAQQRAARLYGARETFFLVNGSTAGILSAVSGCTSQGGKLLMARNCHKAVYHAAALKELDTVYLYPEKEPEYGLNGGITPGQVEQALREDAGIEAVIITSPTYDGVVSDVRGIARAAHRFHVPLIVDEAHGAHFRFHPCFPVSAVDCGADVVIQSVHKTLPSLTQTALLHLCGSFSDGERIRRYLSVYQTSSPSYVLMASIDRCMELLEEDIEASGGKAPGSLFQTFFRHLQEFREEMQTLKHLQLVGEEITGQAGIYALDPSKLVISGKRAGIPGLEIQSYVREKHRMELEMAAGSYALGISTVMDTREGFERLFQALKALDEVLGRSGHAAAGGPGKAGGLFENGRKKTEGECMLQYPEKVCRISEAETSELEELPLAMAAGRICGEYIYLYPPGIPLVTPGERLTGEMIRGLTAYVKSGYTLEGMRDLSGRRLLVMKD
ncbi:MAG: aminotransferase class V-fold PLP-dependent enzyme [Lachnospiraceae bacterium]|nr:aminotransferase class V-fold PLP-dependent enzyme [Lachnospiraceae bacterium]